MERLHILDGYGYIFRAFYGLSSSAERRGVHLSTASGMPTGALYVYTSMLIRLHKDVKPDRIVVVFDAPGRTFRKELAENYKATRPDTPEDLKPQLPYFSLITQAFSWPTLAIAGVEADDVIATLVTRARRRDWDVHVYSGDKDLLQLVSDHVRVEDALRKVTYDANAVIDKFGVGPDKIRDYLALVGDTSDNVPGMPGVGKKTAASLLNKYHSIDGILAHVDEFKGKQRERFEDPALIEQLRLSQKLVTLHTDVDIGVELDALKPSEWDSEGIESLFHELEFQVLLTRLAGTGEAADSSATGAATGAVTGAVTGAGTGAVIGSAGAPSAEVVASASQMAGQGRASVAKHTVRQVTLPAPVVIRAPEDLAPMIAAIERARVCALKVETDGARPDRARVISMAVAAPDTAPAYIPMNHRYLGVPSQLALTDVPAALLAQLADPDIAVLCHDAKSTRRALASIGVALEGIAADTMLAAYLLDPDRDFAIERVIAGVLAVELRSRKSLLGKGKSKIDFETVTVEAASEHSAGGAHAVLLAREEMDRRLETAGLSKLMYELELPLAILLSDMEQAGICVDVPYLNQLSAQLSVEIKALEARVYALAGEEFNLGSPKQLAHVLFDKLGLKADKMRKTKTGSFSTDHDTLESLSDDHEVIAPILEHRELIKLDGTYLKALPPLVDPATKRIHTSFNQAVAATGRLSSQDPNLQNIPVRSELGKKIRRAFVADEGKVLVSVDYSQIELRILAHLSGDPVLVKAFQSGVDVHTQTAAEVFGVPLDQVGDHERRVAKAVNYGLVYGQSQFGLARSLGIPQTEAKKYINRYFQRLSTVRSFMDELVKNAHATGMVTTIMGRRRPLGDINSKNYPRRQAAERMAKNTPMQGSAADIIKVAMLKVAQRISESTLDAKMLLTVHDELVFEVAPEQAEEFAAMAASVMVSAYPLDVPLEVTVGMGRTWADAH